MLAFRLFRNQQFKHIKKCTRLDECWKQACLQPHGQTVDGLILALGQCRPTDGGKCWPQPWEPPSGPSGLAEHADQEMMTSLCHAPHLMQAPGPFPAAMQRLVMHWTAERRWTLASAAWVAIMDWMRMRHLLHLAADVCPSVTADTSCIGQQRNAGNLPLLHGSPSWIG